MLLILRDEDVDTVSGAITAIALQNGLEPVEPAAEPTDIFTAAAMLLGPRVVLTPGEDFVLASGLETLDVGDARALGGALSAACGNEIVAIAPAADGIRVSVFDDGDLDEDVPVDLNHAGKTSSPDLAEIAPTEEAAEELKRGLSVTNAVELAAEVLRLFGAPPDRHAGEPSVLAFRRPESEGDDDDDDE